MLPSPRCMDRHDVDYCQHACRWIHRLIDNPPVLFVPPPTRAFLRVCLRGDLLSKRTPRRCGVSFIRVSRRDFCSWSCRGPGFLVWCGVSKRCWVYLEGFDREPFPEKFSTSWRLPLESRLLTPWTTINYPWRCGIYFPWKPSQRNKSDGKRCVFPGFRRVIHWEKLNIM